MNFVSLSSLNEFYTTMGTWSWPFYLFPNKVKLLCSFKLGRMYFGCLQIFYIGLFSFVAFLLVAVYMKVLLCFLIALRTGPLSGYLVLLI